MPTSTRLTHIHSHLTPRFRILIIGGGPCGLSCALTLRTFPDADVTVVEERARPTRDNVVLLSSITMDRLAMLGVEDAAIGPMRCITFVDETKSRAITQSFVCKPTPSVKPDGFEVKNASAVLDAQERGSGIRMVSLMDLEVELEKECGRKGVKVVRGFRVEEIAKDCVVARNGRNQVLRFDNPALVVVCEGGKAVLAEMFGLTYVKTSPEERYLRVNLIRHVGANVVVASLKPNDGERDLHPPGKYLKRIVVGDAVKTKSGIVMVQIPAEFNDSSCLQDDQVLSGTDPVFSTKPSSSFNENAYQRYGRESATDLLQRLKWDEDIKVENVSAKPFTVFDKSITQHTALNNRVIFIGDAARTGHFFTGVGTTVCIVTDCALLRVMVEDIIHDEANRPRACEAFDEGMRETAKIMTEYHNRKWYI